jgi:hypothetical protein
MGHRISQLSRFFCLQRIRSSCLELERKLSGELIKKGLSNHKRSVTYEGFQIQHREGHFGDTVKLSDPTRNILQKQLG